MKSKDLLLLTVQISLIVQLLTGLVSAGGIFVKLDDKDLILHDVLLIETIVQLIEGLFYVYIAYAIKNIKEESITSRRYFDWVITTPIMLLSTIMFMEYESSKKINETVTTKKVLNDNKKELIKIGLYNFGMLAFGYLGETNIISKQIGIPIGFVFFGLSFYEIWDKFAYKTEKTRNLYYFLIGVWSLYGVAAMLPVLPKNIMYNILDIIAKNFYGLYIFYEIIKLKK
tara:strand:- start:193 stop:876 length:684 start_codon:yes stop_codon:yes gene_type:complete